MVLALLHSKKYAFYLISIKYLLNNPAQREGLHKPPESIRLENQVFLNGAIVM